MIEFTSLLAAFEEYYDRKAEREDDLNLHIRLQNKFEEKLSDYVDGRIARAMARGF